MTSRSENKLQKALFHVAYVVFCDGSPRTRKAIDYFICAALDSVEGWDPGAILTDETEYDAQDCADALLTVWGEIYFERWSVPEARRRVQELLGEK